MASGIRDYLTSIREMRMKFPGPPQFQYTCMEDFVLEHGIEFKPGVLPAGLRRGAPKNCFQNAALRVLADPELVYVEGYASSIIPVHHAWVVHRDHPSVALDVTWTRSMLKGAQFYGVAFHREYLRRELHRCVKEQHGFNLLDQWEADYPLFLRRNPAGVFHQFPG